MTLLRASAVAFGAAIAVHFADHLRRGIDASPRSVIALGTAATVLQVVAIVAVLRRHPRGPRLAFAVGLGDAIGVFAVHLLPRWSAFSDAFFGTPRAPRVTGFSLVTGVAEVVTALLFAYAGWVATHRGPAPAVGTGPRDVRTS